jgi:hypothetical protein
VPSGAANAVAQASDGSAHTAPPSATRSQSFGCNAWRARSATAGSCCTTQRSNGPAMPGATGLGCGSGHASSNASARVSGHSSAGRSARPAASVNTTPCIWPDRPIARTAERSSAGSCAAASQSASHQRATSISAQPGLGVSNA